MEDGLGFVLSSMQIFGHSAYQPGSGPLSIFGPDAVSADYSSQVGIAHFCSPAILDGLQLTMNLPSTYSVFTSQNPLAKAAQCNDEIILL